MSLNLPPNSLNCSSLTLIGPSIFTIRALIRYALLGLRLQRHDPRQMTVSPTLKSLLSIGIALHSKAFFALRYFVLHLEHLYDVVVFAGICLVIVLIIQTFSPFKKAQQSAYCK